MSALSIDTLAAAQTLRKRGFTEDQATGVIEVLREMDASSLATKADIDRLDAKIETTAANLKVDIVRWLVVTQLALAGFIFAAVRFIK